MHGVKISTQRITARLIVRPFQKSDFPAWLQAHQDELHIRNKAEPADFSEKDLTLRKFTAKLVYDRKTWDQDILYAFGIFLRTSGECVGAIDLATLVRLKLQCANLGYAIYKQHRRNGYAQEAAQAVLDIAFKDLHFHRVEACAELTNEASIRVARGIGMRREGIRRRHYYTEGKWTDNVCLVANPEDLGLKPSAPRIKKGLKDTLS